MVRRRLPCMVPRTAPGHGGGRPAAAAHRKARHLHAPTAVATTDNGVVVVGAGGPVGIEQGAVFQLQLRRRPSRLHRTSLGRTRSASRSPPGYCRTIRLRYALGQLNGGRSGSWRRERRHARHARHQQPYGEARHTHVFERLPDTTPHQVNVKSTNRSTGQHDTSTQNDLYDCSSSVNLAEMIIRSLTWNTSGCMCAATTAGLLIGTPKLPKHKHAHATATHPPNTDGAVAILHRTAVTRVLPVVEDSS